MSTRAIATSFTWQIGSQVVTAVLSTITVKFVAIALSKELAGSYNSAYGFLQFFGILADFGLYAVSVRELSRAENRQKVLGALVVLRLIILALSLGCALFIVWLVPQWQGTPLPTAVAIASLVPFFTLLAGILRTVFQVHYKLHFVFLAEVSQRVLTVALMALLIVQGVRGSTSTDHLNLLLWTGAIGALLLLILSLAFAWKLETLRPCFEKKILKQLLQLAIPYGLAYLCISLYRQTDLTMIALLRPDFELQNAYYGFVGRITEMTYTVPTFLLNSTLPIVSLRYAQKQDTMHILGKALFATLVLGVIASLFALFWSRPIIQVLTTEAYLSRPGHPGSDTALRLLSMPMLLNGLVLFGFYSLLVTHGWKSLLKIMLSAAMMSIGLNMLMIPRFGFIGAAQTQIIIHLYLAAALLWHATRALPVSLPTEWITNLLCYGGVLALALYFSAPWLTTTPLAIVGLGLGGGAAVALGYAFGLHKPLMDAVKQ